VHYIATKMGLGSRNLIHTSNAAESERSLDDEGHEIQKYTPDLARAIN